MDQRTMVLMVTFLAFGYAPMVVGCGNQSDNQSDNARISSGPAKVPLAVEEAASGADPSLPDKEAVPVSAEESTASTTPAETALTSIFSPARAPERRTMGLLQRTFVDIAADGQRDLQLALVIDGTDSMADDLAGVRRSIHTMLDDLRKYRQGEVRVAVVVYRDAGSPSGSVVIPLNTFTADDASIERAMQSLTPESGAPFFHELPDLGLYEAIDQLPWSTDNQVTKWILLFGDAPPYADSRSDNAETEGKRRFGDSVLIGAAKAKGIQIHCVLCTSRPDVADAYNQSLNQTRTFMSKLASDTGGLMLDLSDPQTRSALATASKVPQINYTEIRPITAIDLASVRREDLEANAAGPNEIKRVRIAVLPHLPLDQIRSAGIDPALPEVQVSTALRDRLSRVTGVSVASPVDIQRQLRRLRLADAERSQTIRGLAARLGVDYVVWGELAPQTATYQTAAYRRDTGQRVVEVDLPTTDDQGTWAHLFLTAASQQAGDDEAIGNLLDQIGEKSARMQGLRQPLANSRTTTAELLKAIESLDQALQYDTRSTQAAELLQTADAASRAAATAESDNALAHWLQANVAYNQAAHSFQTGNIEEAGKRMTEMKAALNRAMNLRDHITLPSLLIEVQADYLLLNRRQFNQAVQSYQKLTQPDQPPSSQLRAHWMLAGIHAGDWGTAESAIVNADKARLHVMQILANWPQSHQATLLKRWLKFDEMTQQTEFNYLPTVNIELSNL